MSLTAQILFLLLFAVSSLLSLVFLVRQIGFSLVAMSRPQASPFSRAPITEWPSVTVLVPAHNEERVIAGCLEHLLALDYPADKLTILVVNDRSSDGTAAIVDDFAARSGGRIRPLHRPASAQPGKPAAVADALRLVSSELLVFFDADYLPQPPLLKKLVAPFVDPQVGATMGRVVPYNTQTNLLTRLLDLERRGGYTIDQAARGMWNLLPQFGGTVGGIRMSALAAVGGWSAETLAEDTDLTYRLFIGGWGVEYVDDAMCYEESPENWEVRFRQVRRWACGHNQCLFKYFGAVVSTPRQTPLRRLDAALVLLFFLFPPLSLLSLAAALAYPTLYSYPPFNFAVVSALSFVIGFGNFAPYFQIAAAAMRDRQVAALAMLPLIFLSSAISMVAATQGLFFALRGLWFNAHLSWDKTARFRSRHVGA
ncbi:glycosyltransferase family 2 protein [Phenylobacterium sp.]|jgi:cellulose synthase/poly-beta-1,6-N-acetylglucosamine synthase-like glycosyltransferase|uniref:glycosyltransferase family 2 protein n=1 Tax=Phenylobacterium sp. TaxID=1871053 RepID=UPI002E336169|nr:glycosyltransferase family 2 protein [Phenylobacterium sp.]HEX2560225.1 glycosyltransferase family 2 protein [Phenylobacterium sp.]